MDNLVTDALLEAPAAFAYVLVATGSIVSGCWIVPDPLINDLFLLVSSLHMYRDAMEHDEEDSVDYYTHTHGSYKDPFLAGDEVEKGPAE